MGSGIFLRRTLCLAALVTTTAFSGPDHPDRVFSGYAEDELRYFDEVAFRDDRLYRWRRPIELSVTGKDPALEPVLDLMIRDVRPLLGNLTIRKAEKGNLVIHQPHELAQYASRYTLPGPLPLGYAVPQFAGTELTRVDIYIHPLLLPDKREEVLRHELCHALGLLQHATTLYAGQGLLSPPSVTREKRRPGQALLSRLDRAAIRLLYDARLRPGLSRSDFRRKTGL